MLTTQRDNYFLQGKNPSKLKEEIGCRRGKCLDEKNDNILKNFSKFGKQDEELIPLKQGLKLKCS